MGRDKDSLIGKRWVEKKDGKKQQKQKERGKEKKIEKEKMGKQEKKHANDSEIIQEARDIEYSAIQLMPMQSSSSSSLPANSNYFCHLV